MLLAAPILNLRLLLQAPLPRALPAWTFAVRLTFMGRASLLFLMVGLSELMSPWGAVTVGLPSFAPSPAVGAAAPADAVAPKRQPSPSSASSATTSGTRRKRDVGHPLDR